MLFFCLFLSSFCVSAVGFWLVIHMGVQLCWPISNCLKLLDFCIQTQSKLSTFYFTSSHFVRFLCIKMFLSKILKDNLSCVWQLHTQKRVYHREGKWSHSLSDLSLCDPMDYTVHGILQVRIMELVAFPFSRGSSKTRDQTQVSHIAGGFFTSWATREACREGKGEI